ncbi:hypothetical protein DITRI_Ditri13aG0081000 [Diplodiscus trichospermus]
MYFGVIIWSIWLHRNDIIFRGNQLNLCKLVDLIKFRIAIRVKEKWPQLHMGVNDIIRNPAIISIPAIHTHPRPGMVWINPAVGYMKFNVDGSSLGKPGPAGIGGILRNHQGEEVIRFSKSIGFVDSNEVELLAIREAFILFITSRLVSVCLLIIESDSKTAVTYINSLLTPHGN